MNSNCTSSSTPSCFRHQSGPVIDMFPEPLVFGTSFVFQPPLWRFRTLFAILELTMADTGLDCSDLRQSQLPSRHCGGTRCELVLRHIVGKVG